MPTMTNTLINKASPALRAEWRAKAEANKEAEKLETAAYKQDFKDEKGWREYASRLGIAMPPRHHKPTTGRIAKFRKRAEVSVQEIKDSTGVSTVQELIDCNPDWPMWAIAGLVLEVRAQREGYWIQSDRYSIALPAGLAAPNPESGSNSEAA